MPQPWPHSNPMHEGCEMCLHHGNLLLERPLQVTQWLEIGITLWVFHPIPRLMWSLPTDCRGDDEHRHCAKGWWDVLHLHIHQYATVPIVSYYSHKTMQELQTLNAALTWCRDRCTAACTMGTCLHVVFCIRQKRVTIWGLYTSCDYRMFACWSLQRSVWKCFFH